MLVVDLERHRRRGGGGDASSPAHAEIEAIARDAAQRGLEVGLSEDRDRCGVRLQTIGVSVEHEDAVVPPVSHEQALPVDVIGEGERDLHGSRRRLPQLSATGVRLAEHDRSSAIEDAILVVETEHKHPVVVLIVDEQAMIDRI